MAAPRLDGIDLYHGNVITDIGAIPHFKVISHKATEGDHSVDPLCAARIPVFSADGKFIYHWIRPDSSAAAQWANFLPQIKACGLLDSAGRMKPQYGIMFDWEKTQGVNLPNGGFPTMNIVNGMFALADAAYPKRKIVYSAPWVQGFIAWRRANPDVPLWLADYSASSLLDAQQYNAVVLQYTNHAVVPGVKDPCDGNMVLRQDVLNSVLGVTVPPVITKPPPIINPPLPPQGDEMNVIVKVLVPNDPNNATYGATFYGSMDSRGVIRDVVWSGRGDGPTGPAVAKRLTDLTAIGVPTQYVPLANCTNINLLGNVPQGDPTKVWTGAEFAPNS